MYGSVDIIIIEVRIILLYGENIPFDASLIMYMDNTSNPPITIMNRI